MKRICQQCGKECSGHICRECYSAGKGRSEATRRSAKRGQERWRLMHSGE